MTPFEFLSVLLSIILGLAITQVLQGYRGLLLARGRIRWSAPALIWSGFVLIGSIQAWWASFGLRDHAGWSFASFLVVVAQFSLFYMLAAVVLPDVPEGASVDLPAHYEAQRVPFFLSLLGVLAASVLKDWMLDGHLPAPLNLGFHLTLGALALAALLVRRAAVQLAVAILVALSLAAYIAVLFSRLSP